MRKKIIPLHFFQMGIFASRIAILAFANATPSAATGEMDTPTADAGAIETSVFGTVYAEIFATQTAAAHTPTPTMSDSEATISAGQTNVVATRSTPGIPKLCLPSFMEGCIFHNCITFAEKCKIFSLAGRINIALF